MKYVVAAVAGAVLCLSACHAQRPEPLQPKNVSAPLEMPEYLPPGLATSLKVNDAVSLKVPLPLLNSPRPGAVVNEQLPAGAIVTLKYRVLNTSGPWWLVMTRLASGWVPEHELLRK